MSQLLGKAYIKYDGQLLDSLPGAKCNLGGDARPPIVLDNGKVGFAANPQPGTIECEIVLAPETRLANLRDLVDSTVLFECDTGQVYVLRNAFITDTLELTAGEGGKVPLKFAGPPMEEMT